MRSTALAAPSTLLLLCFLVKGLSDDRYLGYAGFPVAAAIVMRSTDLLLVLPVAAWIAYAHRSRARSWRSGRFRRPRRWLRTMSSWPEV